jgi:hypothetical protein
VRRLRTLAVVALAALALSGCTLISASSKPTLIGASHVQFGLLGRYIPGTHKGRVRFKTQPIYIVDATGHLAPSSRIVTAPVRLTSVLDQLILGPTKIESFGGYATDLPSNLVILQATITNKVGYIDVSQSLAALGRAKEVLAIGQLVFTAYYAGATSGITISVAGQNEPSLLPNRTFASVVTVKDCEALLEP